MFAGTSSILRARRQKAGLNAIVGLAIGGLFLVLGITVFVPMLSVNPAWTRVTGTIVDTSSRISDGSTQYTAVIEYQAGGQTYRVTGGSSSSAVPQLGASRDVTYDPNHPQVAKAVPTGFEAMFVWLFPAVGAVVVLLSLWVLIRSFQRGGSIKQLKQSGTKLTGVVVELKQSRVVVAATDATGTPRTFTSDVLAGIGTLALADLKSKPIAVDVFVDPSNPEHYYVDIDDLPGLTPDRIADLVKQAGKPANDNDQIIQA